MASRTEATAGRRAWIALVLACVSLAYFSLFRSYGLNLPDEGTLLHKFERLADGERLYADFHAGYTPGVFHVHALLQGAFGESILPGRVVLGVVNSLAVAMLFLIAAPLTGAAQAATAALLYAALMPVHPGHFATFNIPYPTWYSVALFLAGLLAARRFLAEPATAAGSKARALTVGVLAGIGFYFKPNIGAFQLAAGMLVVLAGLPRRGLAVITLTWWLTWAAVLAGVLAVFGGMPESLEIRVFLLPVLAAAYLVAVQARANPPAVRIATTVTPILLVTGGFLAVTVAWFGAYLTEVSFSVLLKEALFVGSDYANFFYLPHPPVLWQTLAIVGAFVVLYQLPRAVTFTGLVVAALVVGVVLARRPMLFGFVASVMSEIETVWAFAAALAAMWLLLAVALAAPRGATRLREREAALIAVAVGAPLLYLGSFPRTDYMHWVWAAPLAVVCGAVLLGLLAAHWSSGLARPARAVVTCVSLAPLVLLGALRVESGLHGIFRLQEGRPVYRESVPLGAHRAPLWMNIGQAEGYRDLEAVVDALRELTEPGEKVFTFPALDVISYLADRPTPLRDSYFFPRWIGRDDELEDLRALEAAPPRFVVVLHDDWTFFDEAPVYYTALGDFVTREYRHYLQLGRYAILAHRSVTEAPPENLTIARGAPDPRLADYLDEQILLCPLNGSSLLKRVADLRYDYIEGYYPVLTDLLAADDVALRGASVSALRSANDERVGAALAKAAAGGALPERERQLALRLAGVWGPKAQRFWFGEKRAEP